MSGENAEMSSKQEKKALVINDRINSLSIDINANLKRIREINGFLFASDILGEEENKKAQTYIAQAFGLLIILTLIGMG